MNTLRDHFEDLVQRHKGTDHLIASHWSEVEAAYSARGRHYHALSHIEDIHVQLEPCRDLLQDADAVLLAIVFHDLIIKVTRSDNEQRSAERMQQLLLVEAGFPKALIGRAYGHILATKKHELSNDPDTNFFVDADLSILGSGREQYARYAAQVRKEYRRFPDLLYNPGRRKVLQHFLSSPTIYKTEWFRDRYERSAKENLEWEISNLTA